MEDKEKSKAGVSRTRRRGNCRYIMLSDNVPEHWEALLDIASSYDWYAAIFHDKDEGVKKHLHIVCYDKGGTTLKRHCDRFSSVLPSNFIEYVVSPGSAVRYLTHLKFPEKHQYSIDEISTNSKDKLMSFFTTEESSDVLQRYKDYSDLLSGIISLEEYLDKYRGEFYSMSFFQQQSIFHKIYTGFSAQNKYDLHGNVAPYAPRQE